MRKGKMTEEEKFAWWARNKAKAEAKRKQENGWKKSWAAERKQREAEFNRQILKWHGSDYGR
jgi:hypothetical protein